VLATDLPTFTRNNLNFLNATEVETVRLGNLGFSVTRVRGTSSVRAAVLQDRLRRFGPGTFALNHIYRPAQQSTDATNGLGALGWTDRPESCGQGLRIGIVDTHVALARLGDAGAPRMSRRFAAGARSDPSHGTTVAAFLVGAPNHGVDGALPGAALFAADAFHETVDGAAAETLALLRALDWLARQDVHAVNLSLTGPANPLLERAITALKNRNIAVTAAAGNDGPLAGATYPAAYPEVIGVTAVGADMRRYALANRGKHVFIAGPGVGLKSLDGKLVTGTSFAVPFVTAAIADVLREQRSLETVKRKLSEQARDLGPAGPDDAFGHGLLRHTLSCAAGTNFSELSRE
jgi:subtilisin family serine protease